MTPHLSKFDQGIQILQLKKGQKFLLFCLLFSKCFHLYLSPQPQSPPFDVLAASHIESRLMPHLSLVHHIYHIDFEIAMYVDGE